MKQQNYESPILWVVEIEVEKGFAASDQTTNVHMGHFDAGGSAW